MKQTSLANTLWRENEDLAQATLEHPFVRGLAEGTLPREDFQHYIAQDAYYLESFARAYALVLAHSPDRRGLEEFSALVSGVVEELCLHEGYAKWKGCWISTLRRLMRGPRVPRTAGPCPWS